MSFCAENLGEWVEVTTLFWCHVQESQKNNQQGNPVFSHFVWQLCPRHWPEWLLQGRIVWSMTSALFWCVSQPPSVPESPHKRGPPGQMTRFPTRFFQGVVALPFLVCHVSWQLFLLSALLACLPQRGRRHHDPPAGVVSDRTACVSDLFPIIVESLTGSVDPLLWSAFPTHSPGGWEDWETQSVSYALFGWIGWAPCLPILFTPPLKHWCHSLVQSLVQELWSFWLYGFSVCLQKS